MALRIQNLAWFFISIGIFPLMIDVLFAATVFNYTGGRQNYTVPSNFNLVRVKMWGAGGGGGCNGSTSGLNPYPGGPSGFR